MILRVRIKDFAIIDELEIEFSDGLNIITGETGAGKSIIVNALSLLSGGRGSADYIRTGREEAEIEGIFDISRREDLVERLKEKGFFDDELLIVRRVISKGGKGRLYINAHLAPISLLSSLMEGFVDIYSQGENLLLLKSAAHIDMLDEFGGLLPLRNEFALRYRRFKELGETISELRSKLREREARKEILYHQLREIRDASLKEGEEEELKRIRSIILNRQRLLQGIGGAYEFLYEKEGSSLDMIDKAISSLKGIEKIEQKLTPIISSLEDVKIVIRDLAEALSRLMGELDQDISVDMVEERLERIQRLKKKYGDSYQAIMDYASRIERELKEVEGMEEIIEEKERELEILRKEVLDLAERLSKGRREASAELEEAVKKELSSLGLKGSRFIVNLVDRTQDPVDFNGMTFKGREGAEFFFSANPGEDSKPLSDVASGGELSRLMLAMKKVLFKGEERGILVFDEIDTGIGGAMAEVVGRELREISRHHQVLCITHLPQIACFGDNHLCITKEASEKGAAVSIKKLSYNERIMEIARMLSGLEVTARTVAHAKEMMDRVSRMEA